MVEAHAGACRPRCYLVFFFPAIAIFAWLGWEFFLKSFRQNERIVTSPWLPIVWPFKFMMPLSAVLLLLQGISEFLQSWGRAFGAGDGDQRRRARPGAARRGHDMSAEWFGILLLGVLFVAIFIGFPIAFTLIAVAAIGGYAMLGPLALHLMTLQVFSVMRDPTLASVPFFLFMGFLLEQSGLMERLFRGIQLAFASVRGSLYLAVLVTATIFAAATGIVGSSVTLLGVMAAPAMKRSGYDIRLSAGAIAAGGTLGILIPPSVMLIVMGPVVGVPATDLFAAAVIPGLVLALLYIVYTLVRSYLNPALGPALPMDERAESIGEVMRELVFGIAPIVVVIFATLGVILAGIATPTDAGAVGSFAVLLMTFAYRRMTWDEVSPSGLLDAAHLMHDPPARRGVELLRRRVLAAGQRDADCRIAAAARSSRRR